MAETIHGTTDIRSELRGTIDSDPLAYHQERTAMRQSGVPTWIARGSDGTTSEAYDYYIGGEAVVTIASTQQQLNIVGLYSNTASGVFECLATCHGLAAAVAAAEQLYRPNPFSRYSN